MSVLPLHLPTYSKNWHFFLFFPLVKTNIFPFFPPSPYTYLPKTDICKFFSSFFSMNLSLRYIYAIYFQKAGVSMISNITFWPVNSQLFFGPDQDHAWYLLAPAGALYVMVLCYIWSQPTFWIFTQSIDSVYDSFDDILGTSQGHLGESSISTISSAFPVSSDLRISTP